MSADIVQNLLFVSIGANGVVAYLGFRLISYYLRQVAKTEAKYQALAEMRETTKIEDVMTTLERDIKAQNYRHEQEMLKSFNTTRELLEKYDSRKQRTSA